MGLTESTIVTPGVTPPVGNVSIFSAYNEAMKAPGNKFTKFQQLVGQMGKVGRFNPNETESHPVGQVTIMQAVAYTQFDSPEEKLQFFQYLSSLGFNINCGGVRPVDTVLNILISRQEYDIAINVIMTFINIISVEKIDGNGHTALHMLLMQGIPVSDTKSSDAYVLGKMLIYYGVPVNYPDFKHRRTALFYGVKADNTALIEWLLKFSPSMRAGVNYMDVQGFTPLMFALYTLKDKPADAFTMAKTLCENAPVYVNCTNGNFTVMDCLDAWYGINGVEIRDYLSRKGAVNRSLLKDLAYPIQELGKLVQAQEEIEKMPVHVEPTRVVTPARAERPKAPTQERRDNVPTGMGLGGMGLGLERGRVEPVENLRPQRILAGNEETPFPKRRRADR